MFRAEGARRPASRIRYRSSSAIARSLNERTLRRARMASQVSIRCSFGWGASGTPPDRAAARSTPCSVPHPEQCRHDPADNRHDDRALEGGEKPAERYTGYQPRHQAEDRGIDDDQEQSERKDHEWQGQQLDDRLDEKVEYAE